MSASEPQAPDGSRHDDTDDDVVKLSECVLVAVEVRKGNVDVRDEDAGWTPVVRSKSMKKSAGCVCNREYHAHQELEWDTGDRHL